MTAISYSTKVWAQHIVALGAEAIKRCDEFFDGAPYVIESIYVSDVRTVGGDLLHYEADVSARSTDG